MNSPPSRLAPQGSRPADDAVAEFEALYRANVAAVTAYFARRSADPQNVAYLTADTFVQVITSFATFDPRKGTPRAWVFGIARRIYAAHCQAHSQQRSRVERLADRRELAPDEVGELIDRIDAERLGRALVTGLTTLPAADRAVVELVDLAGLQPGARDLLSQHRDQGRLGRSRLRHRTPDSGPGRGVSSAQRCCRCPSRAGGGRPDGPGPGLPGRRSARIWCRRPGGSRAAQRRAGRGPRRRAARAVPAR
jgi:RNA polymerase sigma factor (sigma-70 family)